MCYINYPVECVHKRIDRRNLGDRDTPRCGRCVRAGLECKLSFKFKSSIGKLTRIFFSREPQALTLPTGTKFSNNQKWLRPPRRCNIPNSSATTGSQLLKKPIVIYVDETQYLVAGASSDDHACQQHFSIDDGYLDGPELGSPGTPVSISGDVPRNTQPGHSSIETGPLKHPSNSDHLYSKLEIMVADTHPHSQTEYHCNGLGVDGLQTMRPPHRSLSSHTPYHGNVQISHFYDTVALPLKDRTDAILFRHYIQKIAISVRNKSGVGGI